MKIRITNKIKTTDAMSSAIEEKLSFLDKFLNADTVVKVTISYDKKIKKVCVLLTYCNKTIKVTSKGYDFYSIMDDVSVILKEKISSLHCKSVSKAQKRDKYLFYEESNSENNKTESNYRISKRKQIFMKPMTEQEAIIEMNTYGYNSFMFINYDLNQKVCLVYKKPFGEYGIIES